MIESYFSSDKGKLYLSDAMSIPQILEPNSVHCVVTSPPYWGHRAYGDDSEYAKISDANQLGLNKTPELYVEQLVEIFKGIKKVLHPTGTVWLNIADTNCVPSSARWAVLKMKPNVPAKNRIGIPWKLAFALQNDGWHLRADLIWFKPNAPREPVQDRPTYEHEYLFLFSKKQRYFYDYDDVALPYVGHYAGDRRKIAVESGGMYHGGHTIKAQLESRNLGSVWTIPTEPHPDYHYAAFPTKLAARCIRAGASRMGCCSKCFAPIFPKRERETKADVRRTIGWEPSCNCGADVIPSLVLDPFMGRGTVAITAEKLNRRWVGTELIPKYAELIKQNVLNWKVGLNPYSEVKDGLLGREQINISIKE